MKTRESLISLGLSEKKADEVMMLESKMLEQAVKFAYTKKDGTRREAEGTLDPKKMIMENGEPWTPKGEAKPVAPQWFKYFDLDAHGWRQFDVTQLIAVGR